ncbi:hypothetical protein PENTCL1PPCAC_20527, partial [Pristionchus entomophagus]
NIQLMRSLSIELISLKRIELPQNSCQQSCRERSSLLGPLLMSSNLFACRLGSCEIFTCRCRCRAAPSSLCLCSADCDSHYHRSIL